MYVRIYVCVSFYILGDKKRDAHMWKETYMSGKRPILRVRDVLPVCMHELMETFNLKQRRVCLKRDTYVWT